MSANVTMIVLLIAVAMYFWYITVPVYVGMICLQFFLAGKVEDRGGSPKLIRVMALLQIVCLLLPIVLYPIMPGRIGTNEPLGMNEKAGYAAFVAAVVISATFVANCLAIIIGFIRTHTTH